MELEFDKEIDALLRRARGNDPPAAGSHLDADEISAFAEGLVPAAARANMTAHLAECSRCRQVLASTITFAEPVAETVVVAPAVEISEIPWYSRLFRFPAVSYALGGLVLVFVGAVLLTVYVDRQSGDIAAVDKAPSMERPMNASPVANTTSNSANAAAPAANAAPITASNTNTVAQPRTEEREESTGGERGPQSPIVTERDADPRSTKGDDEAYANKEPRKQATEEQVELAKPSPGVVGGVAQPTVKPEPNVDQTATKLEDKEETVPKDSKPLPAAKKKVDDSSLRRVGGKSFRKLGGVWFDTSYNNSQSQTSVKRGTDEYGRLDAGLRSIADQLGGTVVIVWNGKAYRIN